MGVELTIKQSKKGKAPGPDNVTNDLIKVARDINTKLAKLFDECLKQSKVSKEWNEAILIPLHKKGDPKIISNYRPVSLLNTTYKLFTKVITWPVLDENQPREQAGFRKLFSTTDHLHAVNQIIKKCVEYNIPLYMGFVDYNKAFDSRNPGSYESTWQTRSRTNIHQSFRIHLPKCNILRTAAHGLQAIQARKRSQTGRRKLSQALHSLPWRSLPPTKLGKERNPDRWRIHPHLPQTSKELEITRKITLGWQAFGRASAIFKSKDFPLALKRKIYDQCITPTVTYGAETWNLTKKQALKLRTMQRAHERIMLNITWKDRKTAAWIREQTKIRDVLEVINRSKWKWAGHLSRRTRQPVDN